MQHNNNTLNDSVVIVVIIYCVQYVVIYLAFVSWMELGVVIGSINIIVITNTGS